MIKGKVPIHVWEIMPKDETALDVYEGYPRLYRKEMMLVRIEKVIRLAMIYIMNADDLAYGNPSDVYYDTIRTGYIKAVLIDVVEKEIEKIYDSYQLPTKVRILIETYLQKVIADEKRKYESELDGLKGQKAALENKRKKLLEAHYSDAIPLDLMKTEQQKIAKELAAIDHEIDLHNITFEQISANLDMVLDIVENCGEAYRNASDTVKS